MKSFLPRIQILSLPGKNVRKISDKGFTLYTALLSFILILLAGLLINTMITTENASNQIINEVESQSRMQSLADLTRADSLQVVNYGIRNAIEEYTQNEGNTYPYSRDTTSWDEVQADFSRFFFGKGNASILAQRIATNLHVIIIGGPRNVGGYEIKILGGDEIKIRDAVQDVLFKTSGGSDNFLQVVNCEEDTPPDQCVGTFYVNLDFSLISDEQFEALPSIHVRDNTTGRELVEPVIPRGKFRIYVPLRIFRALKYAREIANGPIAGIGLLDPTFNAKLSSLGVGVCDGADASGQSICGYRTQPFTTAPVKVEGHACPTEQTIPVLDASVPKNISLECDSEAQAQGFCTVGGPPIASYDPANAVSRSNALTSLVKTIIGAQASVNLSYLTMSPDFKLLTNDIIISPSVVSVKTKNVGFAGINAGGAIDTDSRCTKLSGTNVSLVFEETNPNYIVVDGRAPLTYEVRIVDSFLSSTSSVNECVTYCLSPSFTDLVFGPDLAGSSSVCGQIVCAPPGAYNAFPTCGNGILDSGESCDPATFTGGTNPVACVDATSICAADCSCIPAAPVTSP